MKIEKNELSSLIPHHGTMCLLDCVDYWDESHVVCHTLTHQNRNNPLRRNGRLHVVHALEYGAQAMAVHGGLLAQKNNEAISPGYLVALRNAIFNIDYLDSVSTPLIVEAHQLLVSDGSFIYEYTISSGQDLLVSARATVISEKESNS